MMIPGSLVVVVEETLLNRQHRREERTTDSWERETGRGVHHEFGLYRLKIRTRNGGEEEEVVIEEDCSSIATRVWDCSVLTSKWVENRCLQQQHQHHVSTSSSSAPIDLAEALHLKCDPNRRPVHVLELGSGMGLLSICLAKMGAAVMSTEHGSTVDHLQRNCARNNVAAINATPSPDHPTMMRGMVHCRELDWYNTEESLHSLLVPRDKNDSTPVVFDLIVVTDCSLTRKDSRGVLDMIHRFGTPGHTKAIVGICHEREGTPYFIESARTEFESLDIVPAQTEYHKEYQSTRHSILLIQV